jgi:hypothetical protein
LSTDFLNYRKTVYYFLFLKVRLNRSRSVVNRGIIEIVLSSWWQTSEELTNLCLFPGVLSKDRRSIFIWPIKLLHL